MKSNLFRCFGIGIVGVLASFGLATSSALAKDKILMAVPTFLTGGGAPAFGIPSRNGVEVIVNAINKGQVPAPYNTKGIAGAQVEAII